MENIENICGNKPVGYIQEEIGNDPNFVFEADPNYVAVQIYNKQGKAITVNSYKECEHYYYGGWVYESNSGYELSLHTGLLVFVVLVFTLQLIFQKVFRSE